MLLISLASSSIFLNKFLRLFSKSAVLGNASISFETFARVWLILSVRFAKESAFLVILEINSFVLFSGSISASFDNSFKLSESKLLDDVTKNATVYGVIKLKGITY